MYQLAKQSSSAAFPSPSGGAPPSLPQLVLKLPWGHENSEYVLSFEIGQRESGFYSGRTDRWTKPPSTVLMYRLFRLERLFYFLVVPT